MASTTEIIFEIDKPGTARATLREMDAQMAKLGVTSVKTGSQIDGALSGASGADRVMMRKFENAARGLDQAQAGAAQLSQNANKAAGSLNGIQAALLNIAGIPHGEAINQITQLAGPAGLGLLIGGFAAVGAAVQKVTGDIRTMNETLRDSAAKANQIKFRGTGGLEQRQSDLEMLRKLQEDSNALIKAGQISDAVELQKQKVGRALSGAELSSLIEQQLRMVKELHGEDPREAERRRKFEEDQRKRTEAFNAEAQLKLDMQNKEFEAADKLRKQEEERHRARMEQLRKENEEFQKGVSDQLQRNNLQAEADKLRAGLGGEETRARQADIEKQRADALARIEKERMPGGDEAERRKALDEFMRLGQGSAQESLERDRKDREIANLKASLEAADTPAKQAYVLDQLLSATSNVGGLTSEQVEARAQAIEQRIGLVGKENIQTVEITLKDESGGALKASLGETPTPETSGTFSESLYRAAGIPTP